MYLQKDHKDFDLMVTWKAKPDANLNKQVPDDMDSIRKPILKRSFA